MQVNLYEAKTRLSELVDRAAAGEEIIIAKAGKPMVRIVPFEAPKVERRPGRGIGKVWIGPDFDDPLPPDIAEAFGAGPDEVDPVPDVSKE